MLSKATFENACITFEVLLLFFVCDIILLLDIMGLADKSFFVKNGLDNYFIVIGPVFVVFLLLRVLFRSFKEEAFLIEFSKDRNHKRNAIVVGLTYASVFFSFFILASI